MRVALILAVLLAGSVGGCATPILSAGLCLANPSSCN